MNKAQQIQIERLRLSSFNNFDGEKVANDLVGNEELYQSFVFGRFKYNQLIELRDLRHGEINADALYVLTTKDKLDGFLKLSKKWKPNETGYYYEDNGKLKTEGTISYRENELYMALGGGLEDNQVLIRFWWD